MTSKLQHHYDYLAKVFPVLPVLSRYASRCTCAAIQGDTSGRAHLACLHGLPRLSTIVQLTSIPHETNRSNIERFCTDRDIKLVHQVDDKVDLLFVDEPSSFNVESRYLIVRKTLEPPRGKWKLLESVDDYNVFEREDTTSQAEVYILANNHYWVPFADALHEALSKNNVRCKVVTSWQEKPHELYIVFCMHETHDLPERFIGYNFEQHQMLTPRHCFVTNIKRAQEVWDYSQLNLPFYDTVNVKARFVPFGFTESDVKVAPSNNTRTTQVMFVGTMSDRRKTTLKHVQDSYTTYVDDRCFGDKLTQAYSSCQVGLNMHYVKKVNILEIGRVIPMLANGLAVVSERGDDKWYTDLLEPLVYYVDNLDGVCEGVKQALDQGPKHHDTLSYLREKCSYAKFVAEAIEDNSVFSGRSV